ncbi:3-methyl-2-oxobutanoate hydroxymethyltransferase [Haladaptatus sp. NG-WS-4]
MSAVTLSDIDRKYRNDERLTMLTAYDAPIARRVEAGGVDMILVGDSAGHNHMGYDDTLPVTLDGALTNTEAVVRGTDRALVIGDMPFMSYGPDVSRSVRSAGRFLQEAGADAVKLETAPGGETPVEIVERCTELGIPVQGHLGLTPQRMNELGGPVIQGREGPDSDFAGEFVDTARRLVDAGIFSLVLEGVTEPVAKRVTDAVDVPTIGIGAGRYTDGQVLVVNDLLGFGASGYKLSKQYADLDGIVRDSISEFVTEVETGAFPTREHVYEPIEDE